jgi:hypothetical protein
MTVACRITNLLTRGAEWERRMEKSIIDIVACRTGFQDGHFDASRNPPAFYENYEWGPLIVQKYYLGV